MLGLFVWLVTIASLKSIKVSSTDPSISHTDLGKGASQAGLKGIVSNCAQFHSLVDIRILGLHSVQAADGHFWSEIVRTDKIFFGVDAIATNC